MNIFKWLFNRNSESKPIEQSISLPTSRNQLQTDLSLHRKRMHHKERRFINRKAIWSLFNFMKHFDDLQNMNLIGYGYYKNAINVVITTHSFIKQNPPTEYQCLLAYRIAGIKYAKGECCRRVQMEDIMAAINWEYNPDSDLNYIIKELDNSEIYWDTVLDNYKRPSARLKRLNYLIESMNNLMQNPDYIRFPQAISRIKSIRSKYIALLAEYNDSAVDQ